MEITLAQAIDIRSAISKRIQELIQERNQVSTITVEKGEKYQVPERNIEVIEAELSQTRQDYLDIDQLINEQNLKPTIEWDGKKISIYTAIELAKQLQGEVNILKSFGNRKQQETNINNRGFLNNGNSVVTVTYALYDVEEYRKRAIKLERKARLLSQTIQATNHKIVFEFEGAERYIL